MSNLASSVKECEECVRFAEWSSVVQHFIATIKPLRIISASGYWIKQDNTPMVCKKYTQALSLDPHALHSFYFWLWITVGVTHLLCILHTCDASVLACVYMHECCGVFEWLLGLKCKSRMLMLRIAPQRREHNRPMTSLSVNEQLSIPSCNSKSLQDTCTRRHTPVLSFPRCSSLFCSFTKSS